MNSTPQPPQTRIPTRLLPSGIKPNTLSSENQLIADINIVRAVREAFQTPLNFS
jgi:hypothetical protein